MHIVYLPLEPLPERYTEEWLKVYPEEFEGAGVDCTTVMGTTLTDTIEQGRFLDITGTIYWKSTQMANVAELMHTGQITNGATIFDADLWHPGLESIAYMRDLLNLDIKIVGVLHAGLWDRHDFLSNSNVDEWGLPFEYGWIRLVDKVFVATEFHKSLIVSYFDYLGEAWISDKIEVTGIPFYGGDLALRYPRSEEKYDIVFPHRLDPEKRPQDFDVVKDVINEERSAPLRSIVTMEEFKERGKDWYYSVLASSRIAFSSAAQETFGYAMLEATALGCTPIVPNRLSYREIFPAQYRYNSLDEAVEMVEHYLEHPLPCPQVTYKYADAIPNMIGVMDELNWS